MPSSSSIDEHYTDTVWLVVGVPDNEPPLLYTVRLTEGQATDYAYSLSFTERQRVIAIPLHIPLPILVRNALEALDGDA